MRISTSAARACKKLLAFVADICSVNGPQVNCDTETNVYRTGMPVTENASTRVNNSIQNTTDDLAMAGSFLSIPKPVEILVAAAIGATVPIHLNKLSVMKIFLRKSGTFAFVFIIANLFLMNAAFAQRFAVAAGNWNGAIWATTAGGIAGTAATPTATDAVTINAGVTVTVNVTASCLSLTYTAGIPGQVTGVTISGTNSLTVTNTITINGQGNPNNVGSPNPLNVGAGTVSAGSIVLQGIAGSGSRLEQINISTGTVTVTGNITADGSESQIIFSGAGTLNAGGTFMSGAQGTFTASTGTVNFDAAGAQSIAPFAYTFNNVTLSNSGAKTLTNATINGKLSLQGTATTAGATPTYGTNAVLEYAGSSSQITSNVEFPSTVNVDLFINNTHGVNLNASKTTFTGVLTVAKESTFALGTFSLSTPTSVVMDGGDATAGASITGSGTLTLGGNVTINDAGTGTSGATISAPVALGASRTFTVADDGSSATDLTITSVVSGGTGVGITKAGLGTMLLSGSNSYAGAVTISQGILSVTNLANAGINSSLGTGNSTSAISIAGAGTLQYTGTATTNSTTRAITLTGTGATIDASGTGTMTLSGAVAGNTFGLVLTGTGVGSESGAITTTSGSLTKSGTGTWTISGTNTYTGTTTISQGILSAGNIVVAGGNSNLGNATSAVVLGSAATSGTLNYTGNAATYTRGFTVSAGGGGVTNTTANLLTIGTGAIADGGPLTLSNTGNGGTTITSVISGTGSVTINNTGSGVTIYSGTNTYTGKTTISAGVLQLGATNVISNSSNFILSGGTFRSGATNGFSETVGTLQLTSPSNSTIALGTGNHTITFANSSGVSWTLRTNSNYYRLGRNRRFTGYCR